MSGHGRREAALTRDEIEAIRDERARGDGVVEIARRWKVGDRRVATICRGVAVSRPRRGRMTDLSQDDVEKIRAQRAAGVGICDIARIWRISVPRAHRIVLDVEPSRKVPGPTAIPLDLQAFNQVGVPDTPANRAACRGHSRAWMRLYRLRLERPEFEWCGDPVEAIPANHVRGGVCG